MFGKVFRRSNNDINGQYKPLGYGASNRIAAPEPGGVRSYHDQQIEVAVRPSLPAGVTAKQNNLFGVKTFHDQPRDGLHHISVDRAVYRLHPFRLTVFPDNLFVVFLRR